MFCDGGEKARSTPVGWLISNFGITCCMNLDTIVGSCCNSCIDEDSPGRRLAGRLS